MKTIEIVVRVVIQIFGNFFTGEKRDKTNLIPFYRRALLQFVLYIEHWIFQI